MYEIGAEFLVGDGCWRGRYRSSGEAVKALRTSAAHRADGSLRYYLDVRGHDGDGGLVYRIVPVLQVN